MVSEMKEKKKRMSRQLWVRYCNRCTWRFGHVAMFNLLNAEMVSKVSFTLSGVEKVHTRARRFKIRITLKSE